MVTSQNGTFAILKVCLPKVLKKTSFLLATAEIIFFTVILWLLIETTLLLRLEQTIYDFLKPRINEISRPEPNFGIWYIGAMIGNIGTIVFVLVNMLRRRRVEGGDLMFSRADVVFALLFGALLLAVTVGGIPALYYGVEAATVNMVLTGVFCAFDIRGYLRARTGDELREYTVYFWFLDAPTFVASAFLVLALSVHGVHGNEPFSIGVAAGMLVLLGVVSSLSSLYISIANSGLGALCGRSYNPGDGATTL